MNMRVIWTFGAVLVWAAFVWADDAWVTDVSGDINDGTSWTSGTAPFSGNLAQGKGLLTQNSGTAVSTGGLQIRGNTQYQQTGGTFRVTGGALVVGSNGDFTNTSKLTMNGGTVNVGSQIDIGANGRGEVVMNDGTMTANFYFALGNNHTSAYGKFTQNGGTLVSTVGTGWITIGHCGTGVFILNDGSATAGKIDLATENGTNSNGSLYVHGGTMKSNGSLQVGLTGTGLAEVASDVVPTETLLTINGDTSVGRNATGRGTLNLKTNGTMSTSSLYVGYGGSGDFNIVDNARLTVNSKLFTSATAGASGTVTQSGGTISVANSGVVVGFADDSTWTMKGGTLSTQTLCVGNAGNGTFYYEGGTLNLTNPLSIGNSVNNKFEYESHATGSGTMNIQSGAALALSVSANVGTVAGTTGTLNLNGGSLTMANKDLVVGATAGTGVGTLNLASGTLAPKNLQVNYSGRVLQSDGSLEVGSLNVSLGKYTMTGGTIGVATPGNVTVNGDFELRSGTVTAYPLNVGTYTGTGTFTQYDGTMKTALYFCLGNNGGQSTGTYTQYGGVADATGGMGWLTIGHEGRGTYSIYDGSLTAGRIDLATQNYDTNVGIINVYGGTVTSNSYCAVGNRGTGTLNIYGGTTLIKGELKSGTATSSVNFFAGENGFGTLSAGSATFGGKYTVGLVGNGIASLKSFDQTNGYNILTLNSGTVDLSTWEIAPLFHVTGNGTSQLNLKFANEALADYVIDATGKVEFAANQTSGWISVTPGEYTYAIELTLGNLNDRRSFLDWVNASGPYEAAPGATADSVEFRLFDPSATVFAFDFSGYDNGGVKLYADGVSGRSYVPEPAAWLLLVLGFLCVYRRKGTLGLKTN